MDIQYRWSSEEISVSPSKWHTINEICLYSWINPSYKTWYNLTGQLNYLLTRSCLNKIAEECTEACAPAVETRFTWDQASTCTYVTPAVSYLPTRLAGCSVGSEISCGVRKLARTPRVIKKKDSWRILISFCLFFKTMTVASK
jgi:hypothetical protein